MTAIAVIRSKHSVFVGGDSAGVTPNLVLYIRADEKVFRVGPFLIGVAGSFRMSQLLRFGHGSKNLQNLRPKGDPLRFGVTEIVPVVRDILKEAGFAKVKGNEKSIGEFIVAWHNRFIIIHADLQVGIPRTPYEACGCGADLVRGSLFSSEGDPRERIKLALRAAEQHSAGVQRPFKILETQREL